MVDPQLARALWWQLEPVHAVTYFAPECRQAMSDVGLRGFWMGYFAGRAAPMGPVAPAAVVATFFNFEPAMVRRAIPDAWDFADPDTILDARSGAAAAAIRRLAPAAEDAAGSIAAPLAAIVEAGSAAGRPLFAANRDRPAEDGLGGLWQAATSLREHRGDGHVAALTERGLDGCEAHALFAASEGVPPDLIRQARGWSVAQWEEAEDRLRARDLLAGPGTPTDEGRRLRQRIERRTDELAAEPLTALGTDAVEALIRDLGRLAEPIVRSAGIPFPNPMGLPRPN